jgi:hypothetical protein
VTYAWLDDEMDFHRKVVAAGNAAFGAWARMLCYARRTKTDGVVPGGVARAIGSKAEIARLLSPKVRLLDQDGEDFRIHDFLDHNMSAAELSERKGDAAEARSEKARRAATARWEAARAAARGNAPDPMPECSEHPERVAPSMLADAPLPHPLPLPRPQKPTISETSTPPSPASASDAGGRAAIARMLGAHRKLAGMDIPSIARDLEEALLGVRMADPHRVKAPDQIAADIAAAVVRLPELPNEEVARGRIHAFVVKGGWDRKATKTSGDQPGVGESLTDEDERIFQQKQAQHRERDAAVAKGGGSS